MDDVTSVPAPSAAPSAALSPRAAPADLAAVARGIVSLLPDGRISLHPAHTDYHIHLRCDAALADGKRARGVVEADALRIHPAKGGGRFIEPVSGEPRIIAGTVRAVDAAKRRVLIDAVIPMWLTATAVQDFGVIREGGLVNCHIRSGAIFRPVGGEKADEL